MPAESNPPSDVGATPQPEPQEPASLSLAADFPTPTRAQWRELVTAVLAKSGVEQDTDPEDALAYTTYDGISIRPLYTADDAHGLAEDGMPGHEPFVRGSTKDGAAAHGWDVRTRHAGAGAAATNAALLTDLERGATSLWLTVGAGSLPVDQLPTALEGVYLDLAPVVLDAGTECEHAARALLELAAQRGVDPGELAGSFGADPIGTRARTGAAADLDVLARLAQLGRAAPSMRLATVDATIYHEAGASDAQELGIATSVGVSYLRALTAAGLDIDAALAALEFRWAVTAEQFPSIAKLRAARRVWDRVAQLCGAAAGRPGQVQHAVTSAAMITRRDPWVNMLRSTIACFAAAVGGAQAITVLPFDSALGRSDDFARRIARNTHAVLHDESSLARVVDAAGGSWFVESLTDELAQAAWTIFTDIEKAGGALTRLDDGAMAGLLAGTQQRRAADIAHRRAPITGVSEFAFVDEAALEREPLPEPAGSGSLLPRVRYAADFEALRDRADAAPQRPTVFLAALGPPSVHSARVGFATNLFAAGGIEPVVGTVEVDGSGQDTTVATDAAVAAFRESGSTVVCLCSSDKMYAHTALPVAAALRAAGATQVWLASKAGWLAGQPTEQNRIDGHLYAGCDALAVLDATLETLGVK